MRTRTGRARPVNLSNRGRYRSASARYTRQLFAESGDDEGHTIPSFSPGRRDDVLYCGYSSHRRERCNLAVRPVILPLVLLAALLFAGRPAVPARDGSIEVQLVYPLAPAAASATSAPVRAASYRWTTNRIRIASSHPLRADREVVPGSDGRGEIGGIPPGERITVEVDEYDSTRSLRQRHPRSAAAGRGWYNGIALSQGGGRRYCRYVREGTIVTVCAPRHRESGTSGTRGRRLATRRALATDRGQGGS